MELALLTGSTGLWVPTGTATHACKLGQSGTRRYLRGQCFTNNCWWVLRGLTIWHSGFLIRFWPRARICRKWVCLGQQYKPVGFNFLARFRAFHSSLSLYLPVVGKWEGLWRPGTKQPGTFPPSILIALVFTMKAGISISVIHCKVLWTLQGTASTGPLRRPELSLGYPGWRSLP